MQIKTTIGYYLILIWKNKKSLTLHLAWMSSWSTRASDTAHPLTQHFLPWVALRLGFQTLRATHSKECALQSCPLLRHVKLKHEVNKTVITLITCNVCIYSLSILFHNWLNCFHYPLMGCKPQSEKHSFQKHPPVNENTCARLRVAAFFHQLGNK